MIMIPNSRFQQEAEQTEVIKQSEKAAESRPSTSTEKLGDSKDVQKTETVSVRQRQFDQYMPEKAGEEKSYGHYKVVSDEEGCSKVQFDNPEKSVKEKISADQVKTDGLDQGQKIQKLKEKQKQLKQKIRAETNPEKSKELKKKLAQIEREIKASGK